MTPYRILIVDDDALTREILGAWFYHNGHTTVAVEDSDEALEILVWDAFDVVITEVYQTDIDGITLTKEIARLGGPPVVVHTGWYKPETRDAALQVGARAFLKKPTPLKNLLEIVDQVVGKQGTKMVRN